MKKSFPRIRIYKAPLGRGTFFALLGIDRMGAEHI